MKMDQPPETSPPKSPDMALPLATRITTSASRALPFLAFATIPFCLLCLFASINDLRAYPGRDLRPKVAGARLLAAGLDPYDFNAPPPDNEYFRTNNLISFTPGLLLLYVPLSVVPYETQREAYFCLDWLFAAGAFYLLQRNLCQARLERYLCWIIYAAFIICSYSFRIHLERGQYYMLLMLLTCCTAASMKSKRADWLSCIPSALLLVLRPTYGLLLPVALICFGARKWTWRVFFLAALLFAMTLSFGGVSRWVGFLRVVHQSKAEFLEDAINSCGSTNNIPPAPRQLVEVIDHVDYAKGLAPHALSGTLTGLFRSRALSLCRVFSAKWMDGVNSLCMALVIAGGLLITLIARTRIISPNILIALMLLWPMIFEIFSPERYLYTAVMEIVPLVLVVFDEHNCGVTNYKNVRGYFLTSILALGVLAPVTYQLVQHTKQIATLTSAFILLVLPILMAGYCAYCVVTSSKVVQREDRHLV
jgi:hypothetical protein